MRPAEIFLKVYEDVLTKGQKVYPRGQETLELENYSFTMNPMLDRFTSFKSRKVNYSYMMKELLWYLRGDRHELTITEEAQIWKDIIDVDKGINSNYGQYLFARNVPAHEMDPNTNPPYSAIDYIIRSLHREEDSRRAVVPLLQRSHLRDNNPDVVCTYYIAFRIRNGHLNMSIGMRSWDMIWGLTNDVFCFSCIYELVYRSLKVKYPDLKVGTYHHSADSLHVYSRHYDMARKMVDNGYEKEWEYVYCPEMTPPEASRLRAMSQEGKIMHSSDEFTKWLVGATPYARA